MGFSLSSIASAAPGIAADLTIRLGQTVSIGDLSVPSQRISRVEAAYFNMVNEAGGIDGLQVTLIALNDQNDPAVALENTRALIDNQHVLAIFGSQGAGVSALVQSYLNSARVPQLFVGGRAARLSDPLRSPWTIAFDPSYSTEGALYGTYLVSHAEHPRIAILRSADSVGTEYLQGMRRALAGRAGDWLVSDAIVPDDEGVERSLPDLRSAGADTLLIFTPATSVARWIERVQASGWQGTIFIPSDSVDAPGVAKTTLANTSLVSLRYLLDPRDPTWGEYSRKRWHFQEFTRWQSQPGVSRYVRDFAGKHLPDLDPTDPAVIYGYSVAELMANVLEACGKDLSRENLMIHAANLRGTVLPLALPGIRVTTNPRKYTLITQGQLIRFDGHHWIGFGALLVGDDLRYDWPPLDR